MSIAHEMSILNTTHETAFLKTKLKLYFSFNTILYLKFPLLKKLFLQEVLWKWYLKCTAHYTQTRSPFSGIITDIFAAHCH